MDQKLFRLRFPRPSDAFTDDTWMPFGKYGPARHDHRQMKDVPAAYLEWILRECEGGQWYPAIEKYCQKFCERLQTDPGQPITDAALIHKPSTTPPGRSADRAARR